MTSTQERIAALMTANIDGDSGASLVGHLAVAEIIAGEIDALISQRDEATAKAKALTLEVERLRPAAEAWETRHRWGKTIDGTAESVKAQIEMEDADDRAAAAREAALKSAHVRGDA